MNLYEKIAKKQEKIAIVGLGYVGLPLAVAFDKQAAVIGYDQNPNKIALYKSGVDPTKEVGDQAVQDSTIEFTADAATLNQAKFYIVAVPTPINLDKTPNLNVLLAATATTGKFLQKGSVVVFESTVYPGTTEEICVPILERESGLVCGVDFAVAYSPERINPGDTEHRLHNIVKVVAGMDEPTTDLVARIYDLIITAGTYRAENIKTAEAAKIIENTQRDINIAFMNELSMIFHRLDIDTQSVLRAAETKWNFLKFYPGLVGGHCIGVDPFYLSYKAERVGYYPQMILSGRKINDSMGKYVAEQTIKLLIKHDKPVKGAKVAIFGVTFKENCPDVRNTKIVDIIAELQEYGVSVMVVDPQADSAEWLEESPLPLVDIVEVCDLDVAIFAVAHTEFRRLDFAAVSQLFRTDDKLPILVDVKGIFDRGAAVDNGFLYWRL